MVEGDPALEELFAWDPKTGPAVVRGPYGNAFGHFMAVCLLCPHWLKAPFNLCGCAPACPSKRGILVQHPGRLQ